MKQKKTWKRIAAALGAIIIIIALSVLVFSFYGTPWTHREVKQKAEAYIKDKYPNISFTLHESKYDAKANQYRIFVTDTDHDHDFIIYYATATKHLSDSYYSETCLLINQEYQSIANELKKKLPDSDAYLSIEIDCNDEHMMLDQTFDPQQKESDVILSYQPVKNNDKHYTVTELKDELAMLQELVTAYPLYVSIYRINASMELPVDRIHDDAFLEEMIQVNEANIKEIQKLNSK